jgi:hypothetical protein
MFRTDGKGNRYVKFYGKPEDELNPKSDLFWDAVRFGRRITQAEYVAK